MKAAIGHEVTFVGVINTKMAFRFAFVNSFGQLVDGRVQVPFGNRYDVKFWVPAFVAPQIRFQNTEAEEDAADVEIPQCHTAEVAIVATEQRLSARVRNWNTSEFGRVRMPSSYPDS